MCVNESFVVSDNYLLFNQLNYLLDMLTVETTKYLKEVSFLQSSERANMTL